jgi:hypothetical protein
LQKKNWNLLIKVCACWLSLLCYTNTYAQVNLSINADNIKQNSLYVDNASTTFITVLSVAPSINLSTTANTLARAGGGTGISSNLITARIVGTGGGVANLLDISSVPTITLSNTPQAIYASLIGALAGGGMTLRYTISNLGNTIWRAGAYSSTLNFALLGINVGTLSPTAVALNLNVAAFITVPALLQPAQLNVNSLDFFRTQSVSATQSNVVTTTVPLGIRIKAVAAAFSYSNGYSGAADPGTSTSKLNTQITSPQIGPLVNAGTAAYTNISPALGFSVPSGNQQTNVVTYSISPAVLKSNFLQQGTYNSTYNLEFFDAGATVQASTKNLNSSVTITVADLGELKVNHANVNLEFNTAADYATGVHADMRAHLTVSKTTPYDIYVKAFGSTLINGSSSLPVNLIDIMPVPASGDNFNTVSLSSTPKKLVSSATAGIDRDLSVRYNISAAKASQLLNKVSGTYTIAVTYSMIAP